jgi:vacuolar-type H+-ATPase subunit I/STV1
VLQRLRGKKEREETLEERIKQLTSSLEDISKVIGDVEKAVEERRELARKLEQDVRTYNNIITLKKDEVEAVAQLLRGELKKEERRGLLRDILINVVFFMLGLVASYFLFHR